MAEGMVVGVDVMLDPPGDCLSESFLPAFRVVPPAACEQLAKVLVPKVGKHGDFKTEIGMFLRELVNRPHRGILGHIALIVQEKLVRKIRVIDGQNQRTPPRGHFDIACEQIVQGDQRVACIIV